MELTEVSIENVACSQKLGGNIYSASNPDKVLDFSSCRNILTTPKNILKAIKKADFGKRPDPEYKKAVANIAQRLCVDCENLVLEKNVYSATDVVLKSLMARSTAVVMPCENFVKDICRINQCDVLPIVMDERRNFKFGSDEFLEKVPSRADTVYICNPNNVTGRVISKGEIKNILEFCLAKGIYVVVDESYMDFVAEPQSAVGFINDYNNLVVIRSVGDYYNVSGVDASFVVASLEIIENLKGNLLPFQVDVYGASLCENAYKNEKFDLKTKKVYFEEKRKLVGKLKTISGVRIIHSDCHFLLLKLEDTSATTVYNRLLKINILIRDASGFTGLDGSYIRVDIRNEKANNLLLENLLRCLI